MRVSCGAICGAPDEGEVAKELTERLRYAVDEAQLRVTLLQREPDGAERRVVVEDESE